MLSTIYLALTVSLQLSKLKCPVAQQVITDFYSIYSRVKTAKGRFSSGNLAPAQLQFGLVLHYARDDGVADGDVGSWMVRT